MVHLYNFSTGQWGPGGLGWWVRGASSWLPATWTRARVHSGGGGGGDTQDQAHTPGRRWAAVLHPGARTHPASSFRRGCTPAPRSGSGAEVWAEPASGAPGTPTGPARPEQSASGGEERERRCTEGELGTRGWRVSMRCCPPPLCRVDRKVVDSVFLSELPRCVLGRLKDVPGWRDSWEEPST